MTPDDDPGGIPISQRLHRGFAAFYLNRCNRSGIIRNGGPIGGTAQAGRWKLDARFHRGRATNEVCPVAEYSSRIYVSGDDALDFIRASDSANLFFFIDPPYFVKGPTLYLNALDTGYHVALANQLREADNTAWVLTYDDCREVHGLYRGWTQIRRLSVNYSATTRRRSHELLIVPKWMNLPSHSLLG